MNDLEALRKCRERLDQNSKIEDEAYYNKNYGLCKIKNNENEWLLKVYLLACEAYGLKGDEV